MPASMAIRVLRQGKRVAAMLAKANHIPIIVFF